MARNFSAAAASMGTVEASKVADLVLLDANPIDSVRNLHTIFGVVRAGRYYARPDLEKLKATAGAGGGITM